MMLLLAITAQLELSISTIHEQYMNMNFNFIAFPIGFTKSATILLTKNFLPLIKQSDCTK